MECGFTHNFLRKKTHEKLLEKEITISHLRTLYMLLFSKVKATHDF